MQVRLATDPTLYAYTLVRTHPARAAPRKSVDNQDDDLSTCIYRAKGYGGGVGLDREGSVVESVFIALGEDCADGERPASGFRVLIRP